MITVPLRGLVLALLLLASGCTMFKHREFALVLNMSDSSDERLGTRKVDTTPQEEQESLIGKLSTITTTRPVRILVAAKDPINIICEEGLENEKYSDIVAKLTKQRELQRGPADHKPQANKEPTKEGQEQEQPFWGWGTDHATPLKWLISHRSSNSKLIVFIVSDGWNEEKDKSDPFADVSSALNDLYKSGPTQVFLLGVSQEMLGDKSRERVIDKWESMFKSAGATEITSRSKAVTPGYYINPELTLPDFLGPTSQ